MSWVQTGQGYKVDVLEPQADQISLIDIATGLSRICRFGGHVSAPHYSVAEHSVIGAMTFEDPVLALHFLLHDAAEAYLGDIVMPVKRVISGFDAIETRMLSTIYDALGIEEPTAEQKKLVKECDLRMLATEKMLLLRDLGDRWPVLDGIRPFDIGLSRWSAEQANREWFDLFERLYFEYCRHRRDQNRINMDFVGI